MKATHPTNAGARFPLLILAIVSAFFSGLFFITATMDLRRIEHVLISTLEKQGVQQADRLGEHVFSNYRQLVNGQSLPGSDFLLPMNGDALSMQAYLVAELVDLALDIEYMGRSPGFSGETVRALEQSERVTDILFIDGEGDPQYGKSFASPDIAACAQNLLKGNATVSLKLFDGALLRADGGIVGIRRPGENGALIVSLGREALRFYAWKASITRAVENFQWPRDTIYVGVYDETGMGIIETGEIPDAVPVFSFGDQAVEEEAGNDATGFISVNQGDRLALTGSLEIPGVPSIRLVMGLSMAEETAIMNESRRHVVLSTGLMILVGLLAMAVLYFMQNRHLKKVQQMSEQLNKSRRLSSLGKLGAGMAHEIRNPLNAISMAAQRLAREYPVGGEKKAGYNRITEVISLETIRLNSLVDDFLTLSTSGSLRLGRHSIKAVVSRVVFLLEPEARGKGVAFALHGEGSAGEKETLVDADRLEQALLNIVRNAIEALAAPGLMDSTETPEIRISLLEKKGAIIVRIRDNGPGIRREDLENIFDPSFTTRQKGVGLGLAIAHEIISAHEGDIRVESAENEGTTFEISIPAW